MNVNTPVRISRDLEVVQIPEGYQVRLARGTEVRVTQGLGGYIHRHDRIRHDGADCGERWLMQYGEAVKAVPAVTAGSAGSAGSAVTADAAVAADAAATADTIKEQAWTALRGVYDPEIPVNVVELGLVYNNDVTALPEGGFRIDVKMTLTAPGCGMGGVLKSDAEQRLLLIPGVKAASVEIVVDPPWNISMVSEAARLDLGL